MSENITIPENNTQTPKAGKSYTFAQMMFQVEPEGRVHRLDFFLRMLLTNVLGLIFMGFFVYAMENYGIKQNEYFLGSLAATIWLIPLFFVMRAQLLKRLRDIGYKTGFLHIFLWIYFLVNLMFGGVLWVTFFDPITAINILQEFVKYSEAIDMLNKWVAVIAFVIWVIPGKA